MINDSFVFKTQEAAVLVQIDFAGDCKEQNDFEEFHNLTLSAGIKPAAIIRGTRKRPDAKYFIGSGKALEIQEAAKFANLNLVLFNHDLTPGQERNLEKLLSCRIISRTDLILDIFARRARTFEGKLQVELAQLKRLSTRLIRGWTHLERQKGGIGLRGPGETQLETDRRLIRIRIKNILKHLDKVRKQRRQAKQNRIRGIVPVVSIIGYTNAGKTTVFNRLTNANEYAADQLFATLDPTLRKLTLPKIGRVIFADTVGFIRKLPHDLIEAFSATLEETQDADLLLHVVDIHDEMKHEYISAVNEVLTQIAADGVPQLLVFNRIDCLGKISPKVELDRSGQPARAWVSAKTGAGFDILHKAIAEKLLVDKIHCCFRLTPKEASIRAKLYELKAVASEEHAENGDSLLEIQLPLRIYRIFFGSTPIPTLSQDMKL